MAVLLALTGCATTEALPKLSYDEAMAWPEAQPRAKSEPLDEPQSASVLAEAMRQFSQHSQSQRTASARGVAMPSAQREAWHALLTQVEHFAQKPLRSSTVLAAARTRLQLETELETDGWAYGDVPPELTERVQQTIRLLARRLAARSSPRRPRASLHWVWPVKPVLVTSAYGERLHPVHGEYRFHAGTDLAADTEQSVYAAEAGTVLFSGWNGGHGKQIELQHDGHVTTRYSHLETLLVSHGQRVKRGELIGLAGQTGLATGVHLHFEVRRDGQAIDPQFLLDARATLAGMASSP